METQSSITTSHTRQSLKPFALVGLACACVAGCAHYEPQPLTADSVQAGLEQRTLDAPALLAFVREHLQCPAPPWDVDALTLAAWYYSPELDKARAQHQASAAAVLTAAQPPVPTLSLPFEYNTTASDGESPYTVGIGLDIPIETAGKRGYRVAQAQLLSTAARLDIGATAWRVRQRLRAQLLAFWDAGARANLLQSQLALRLQLLKMLERRRALGEASSPELYTVRAQVAGDRARLLQAKRDQAVALAAAAGVIGIPAGALQQQPLDLRAFDAPARAPRRDGLLDAALRNRADVQAGLARYEASQSALQLAMANQYPDIHLGPGYTFDAGAHKIVFDLTGLSIPLPRNNRGPIAEATAKRRLAAAQVQATVASALADVDRAFAGWPPAAAALTSARDALAEQERLVHAAAAALRAGEEDRPNLLRSELDAAAARLTVQQALLDLQKAAAAIEFAVQRPGLYEPDLTPVARARP